MINIMQGDITNFKVDAIVNAANTDLSWGGGVCDAIFKKAGEGLVKYCNALTGTPKCATGNSVITPPFNIPHLQCIIHSVGPVYIDGKHNENILLSSAYTSAMNLAKLNKCKSIVFPFISSGIYHYPIDECAKIAVDTLNTWQDNNKFVDIVIIMCAFSDTDFKILKKYNY